MRRLCVYVCVVFFFIDTATTEIYTYRHTLSLPDALPIYYAYIAADTGLVVVDLSTPLEPRVTARLPLTDARASAVQFRYLWVTDAEGVKLFDIPHMDRPVPVPSGTVRPADERTQTGSASCRESVCQDG